MDKKEILKKYWFLLLVIILLVAFIGFYAVDSAKNAEHKVSSKEVDGKSVIYSINGENYFADDLYESLYDAYAVNTTYRQFDRIVAEKAYKTTSEMTTLATNNATYLLQQADKAKIDQELKSLGFAGVDELSDYYIYLLKSQALRTDYLKAHTDELVKPFIEKNEPMIISHILIKVKDVEKSTVDGKDVYTAKPTEEETTKLNNVLEALKTKEFAEVAKEFSEDGSAAQGGYLGYFDNNNKTFVAPFVEGAKTLNKTGDTSEVITSEFGYHIIHCVSTDEADLYETTEFINAIYNNDALLYNKPLIEKANELGIEIADVELKNALMEQINKENK